MPKNDAASALEATSLPTPVKAAATLVATVVIAAATGVVAQMVAKKLDKD